MVERIELGGSFLYRISDGAASVDIVPYGASVRSIRVPDRDGVLRDVCLGYETVDEYAAQGGCLGAIVGRYANRIGGAAFTLNGRGYTLFANEGPNACHGGQGGFHKRWWNLAPKGDHAVVCTIDSPDGDCGFPGHMTVEVTYTWKDGALTIAYAARCESDTVVNLTNHAYFNLAGQDGVDVGDHILTIRADRFTPIGPDKMVTGELQKVSGTPWDLRQPTSLTERWNLPEFAATKGYDHNYCLDPGPEAAATVLCPRTGIHMAVFTDQPGCQLYTAGTLTPRKGKDGAQYGPSAGLCLETQNYPNAVNVPAFPSPVLKAGELWTSETVYLFSVL